MDKHYQPHPAPGFISPPPYEGQQPPYPHGCSQSPQYPYPQPPHPDQPHHPQQPQHPQPPNTVIIHNSSFGSEPQHVTCPHCGANVSTQVETEANSKTHMFALLLCLFGCCCFAPCPYCMDSCLVKKHYCPNCKSYLGQSDN